MEKLQDLRAKKRIVGRERGAAERRAKEGGSALGERNNLVEKGLRLLNAIHEDIVASSTVVSKVNMGASLRIQFNFSQRGERREERDEKKDIDKER
jgi:hypothetical protein